MAVKLGDYSCDGPASRKALLRQGEEVCRLIWSRFVV